MEICSFNKKRDFIINANIADILNLSATINPTGFKNLSGFWTEYWKRKIDYNNIKTRFLVNENCVRDRGDILL